MRYAYVPKGSTYRNLDMLFSDVAVSDTSCSHQGAFGLTSDSPGVTTSSMSFAIFPDCRGAEFRFTAPPKIPTLKFIEFVRFYVGGVLVSLYIERKPIPSWGWRFMRFVFPESRFS